MVTESITINNLTQYDKIIIHYDPAYKGTSTRDYYQLFNNIDGTYNLSALHCKSTGSTADRARMYFRVFTISGNTISFDKGKYLTASTTENSNATTACLPLEIYGIK